MEPVQSYYGEIQSRIETAQRQNLRCKVRKDSVKFIDTIVTASPEYLAALPPERVRRYFERALEFFKERSGRRISFPRWYTWTSAIPICTSASCR